MPVKKLETKRVTDLQKGDIIEFPKGSYSPVRDWILSDQRVKVYVKGSTWPVSFEVTEKVAVFEVIPRSFPASRTQIEAEIQKALLVESEAHAAYLRAVEYRTRMQITLEVMK